MKRTYLLKATTSYCRPIFGRDEYKLPEDGMPGEWMKAKGRLKRCKNGFHASRPRSIRRWLSSKIRGRRLFLVEVRGEKRRGCDKANCREMRFIRELKIPRNVKRRKADSWGKYHEGDIVEILVANGIKLIKLPEHLQIAYEKAKERYGRTATS